MAILDETDSGLDVDALRVVSEGVVRAKDANDLGIPVSYTHLDVYKRQPRMSPGTPPCGTSP